MDNSPIKDHINAEFSYDVSSLLNASEVLKIMSNPHRLKILCCLEQGECSVNQLVEALDISQSALSQHLKILRSADLVVFRREHNKLFYRIHNANVSKIISLLRELYCSDKMSG